MLKAKSSTARLRSRFAIEPVMLALVVAGGVGAYAFRNDPSTAAKPRELPAGQVALAVNYAKDAPAQAGFARIEPARAEQALLQAAAFKPLPADTFQAAFKPMTAASETRKPLLAFAAPVAEPERAAAAPVVAAPSIVPVEAPALTQSVVPAEPTSAAVRVEALAPPAPAIQFVSIPVVEAVPVTAAADTATALAPIEVAPVSQGLVAKIESKPDSGTSLTAAVPAKPKRPMTLALDRTGKAALVPAPKATPVATATPRSAAPQLAMPAALPAVKAKPAAPAAKPAQALAVQPLTKPALGKATAARGKGPAVFGPQIPSRYKLVEGGVETQIGVQLYGERLGGVPLRVLGSGVPSLKLGDLLGLLKNRMALANYEALASSGAAEEFVSLDTLRKAGIAVRYDAARDELRLGEE